MWPLLLVTGEEPIIEGIAPKEDKEDNHELIEKPTTLRVVVDLKFKDAKVKALLEEKPHLSLHEVLKNTDCKELKSHGWKLSDDVITGYTTSSQTIAEALLRQSGEHAVFFTRLRQDVAELPPCTWVQPLDKEEPCSYLNRVTLLAKEAGAPLTRRRGLPWISAN